MQFGLNYEYVYENMCSVTDEGRTGYGFSRSNKGSPSVVLTEFLTQPNSRERGRETARETALATAPATAPATATATSSVDSTPGPEAGVEVGALVDSRHPQVDSKARDRG